jgi:mediator of RNA polymerase II transcription subunit 14
MVKLIFVRFQLIMNFLEKQSMLFVETADLLTKMARETLVHARLPSFHIPAAVEVLTTGSYNRLPLCIKENLVKPDPILPQEVDATLARLNQVIQHRLVTSNLLPQMRKFKIEKGRVTFNVPNEFSVSLTMMGDGDVPWRLLDIDVLVEDKETGDGRPLAHPLQVNYIHELIQRRLVNNQQTALCEVFNCLHFFCQSLQLEVLYTQTLRLCRDRLDDNIHVEEYVIGSKLTVSYWRELSGKDGNKSEMRYRITIQADPSNALAVFHMPSTSLGLKDSEASVREKTELAVKMLSMERLLVHTVYFRSVARLHEIQSEFKNFMKDVDSNLQGTTAILTIPVLSPCLRAEQIHITVDTHTGKFHCHVPKFIDCPIMTEMQMALNSDHSKLPDLVTELRYWITKRRCEKTLQHLPAVAKERLPIITSAEHPATKIGKHKMFVQLFRYPNVILIVGLKTKASNPNEMEFSFYLVYIKHVSIDENSADDTFLDSGASTTTPTTSTVEIPKMFLRVMTMIEFDTFVTTHGAGTSLDGKRKSTGDGGPSSKVARTPAYFIPELSHVVAMCDEKLPFVAMAQELTSRKIPHSGLQVEAHATSLILNIVALPSPIDIQVDKAADKTKLEKETKTARDRQLFCQSFVTKTIYTALQKRLLSIAIRTQFTKPNCSDRSWIIEMIFNGTPLQSTHSKEQGNRRAVYFQYEMLPMDSIAKTVDQMLAHWMKIVLLYGLVHDFAEVFNADKFNLKNIVSIKSYSYTNLLMVYGHNKDYSVNVSWCNDLKQFQLTFIGGHMSVNPHSLQRDQLQAHLNSNHSLTQIAHILNETYQPMGSISKLPILPQLGVPNPKIPVLSFCIIPQSPTLLRISFQGTYCLEVRLRGGGLVSIRDGAYSRFDRINVVLEFTPTQGLKGFLSKYVDENAVYRRRSQSEDDNPPSPIQMDDGPALFRGPQSPRDSGLRFAAPATPPTQSSNPHTPASPHPIGQQQQHGSQHGFNMTSPPTHMPHPSPGFMPSSPLNQPSPMMTAMSPGPSNLPYIQGHSDSPFGAQMSPAAASSAWPGSPIPRPSPRPGQSPDHKPQMTAHHSRILPARSWAGAVPTLLTHEALETLCRPCLHSGIPGPEMSPLERFLGCVFMKRQLQRLVKEANLAQAPVEPGVVLFRAEGLQCQVYSNPDHMQSLQIKITPAMPNPQDMKPPYQWNMDDLQMLEQFFELKVAAPPYRQAAMHSFIKLFSVPNPVLKDLIQIIRLELKPEQCKTMGLHWNVQLCMRASFTSFPIIPIGTPGIVNTKNKLLIFVSFNSFGF